MRHVGSLIITMCLGITLSACSGSSGDDEGDVTVANDATGQPVQFSTTQGQFRRVSSVATPSGSSALSGYSYANGFFGVEIDGLAFGDSTTLTITLPAGSVAPNKLVKCINNVCADYPASISGTRIRFSLTDGGQGDADQKADGVITDPVAPAVDSSGTGGSGGNAGSGGTGGTGGTAGSGGTGGSAGTGGTGGSAGTGGTAGSGGTGGSAGTGGTGGSAGTGGAGGSAGTGGSAGSGGTGGSAGTGGTGGSAGTGGTGGSAGTGGSGGSAGGFPLCEPVSGSNYCLSDIPVIGEILQGAIDTLYNAVNEFLGGGSPGGLPDQCDPSGTTGNCLSDIPVVGDLFASGGNPPSSASSRYEMANGCFALQALDANTFVVSEGSGYKASASSAGAAEPFYMKPTRLGEYLLHGSDGLLLVESGAAAGTATAASPAANWIIDVSPQGGFTLLSESSGQSLAVNPDGALVLAGTPGRFGFVQSSGCTPYPEISTDIVGETYKGRGVDQPVIGFAEVHAHMAMGSEMSDGKEIVGPSAGGVLYGQMFHRFGVPHALDDCAAMHGPNGMLDPEAMVLDTTPLVFHDTQGWPTFVDWPKRDSQLHQMMYYKWVERAWKAGLRIMVAEGTNIEALCEVGQAYESALNPTLASKIDCDDMGVGIKQVKYLYMLQDYVDAQEGGPGKGWYRIVKDPFEARAVINEGKLAVIPGLEFSNIFQCNVTFLPGDDKDGGRALDPLCTEAGIDQQIEEIWELGVRELFPYHDVNSALGGTGIFQSLALNLVGYWGTKRFWDTYDCPDVPYFYGAGAIMYDSSAPSGFGDDPLTGFIVSNFQGPLPVYNTGGRRQCNARGITPLGRYALEKLMAKKFVIDIDHAELSIKQDMIDLGKTMTPQYPFISAHGGHGGISMDQARDILAMGGLIYPGKPNGKGHKDFLNKLKPIWPQGRPLALGFGMDGNGLANLAGPRGASAPPVVYPFTLFQGADWGDKYQGFAPLTVKMQTVPESGKYWDINETGTSHFGLVADYVEEIRLEGGAEALDAFYNSAEAYLQMWEQIVCREPNMPSQCTN